MYIVKYAGPFAFIKPWTAVRDTETFSQQFLTPSILEGIEKKLFPELLNEIGIKKIKRHRLTYTGISKQQEQTQPRGLKTKKEKKSKTGLKITVERPKSIIIRGILKNPKLYLGFENESDAGRVINQHICLCRNEDILFPVPFANNNFIIEMEENVFDDPDKGFCGFELILEKNNQSFIVGYNRFNNSEPMYGWIKIVGSNPLHNHLE